MLDIAYIRQNAEEVKQACKNKQIDSGVVDQLLEVDEKRRSMQQKVDDLRRDSNEHARKLKQAVANGSLPTNDDKSLGKDLKNKLKELEPQLKEVEDSYQTLMYQIPNVPAYDVPVGPDESGNQMVRQVGKPKTHDFDVKSHEEIMTKLGWLDIDRAVRIGGFRSYFLKGDGLRLEQALLRVALDRLVAAGFEPMSVPVLVNEDAMWGTGYFPWGQEDHYKTQDNQFLTGTAEVALTAYRQGEILTEKELPFQICGISPCFRREVGSYGKDTSGVIRVHQFNKVEQVVYTMADETITREWHEKMVGLAEQLLQDLELPYQVLLMCTGDMGAGQRKKYDIETWFPSQQKYRETHSASYFNDFQSRRLNIKYQAKDGSTKFVYTLNNTMAASPRLLAAIIENYQQPDGSVAIPKLLTF
jgi:seryl-tRNA synthetase